jgi:outer membrane protein OmpA-like peptidoglycan-associated protein
VLFNESVAEPVALVIPEERVAFKEDDSVFARKDAAKAALDAVAAQLAGRPHGRLYITGCTALPPGADPQRMKDVATARAVAVGKELTARGVGNIQTRGYGPHCPGRIPDIGPDGASLPEAQAQNRTVLITSENIQPVEAK